MQLAVKVTAAVSRRMQIVENNREENLAMRIYIKNTTTKGQRDGETPISSQKKRERERNARVTNYRVVTAPFTRCSNNAFVPA